MQKIEPVYSKDGHTYWVESGDTLYKQRLSAGQYQKSNWLFAQTLLPQFRTAIDIGSNNACNAINYAKQFYHVECFEPTQLAQQLWHNTVRDNSVTNVTLHTSALGEYAGSTEIILHERNGGHNHLQHYDKNPRAKPERSSRDKQSVQVKRLDDYSFTRIDFVKIDVEGYELFVLKGAEQTLARERPLFQLEIVDKQCRKFNYSPDDIFDWFRARDYRVVSKARGWLDGAYSQHRGDMDLFFVPREWRITLDPKLELFAF